VDEYMNKFQKSIVLIFVGTIIASCGSTEIGTPSFTLPTSSITPLSFPAVTITPSVTPELGTPPNCDLIQVNGKLYALSDDVFFSYGPSEEELDQALRDIYPDWANYDQDVSWYSEPVRMSKVVREASFQERFSLNSTITLVTLGESWNWRLPSDSDLFSESLAIGEELHHLWFKWTNPGNEDIRAQFSEVANAATYAIYAFFDYDLEKLEAWQQEYDKLFGEIQPRINGDGCQTMGFSAKAHHTELTDLRVAYVVGGNIYLQNGSNAPIQLTSGEKDLFPTFSDDGKKLVFLRGQIPRDLYSVNLDGSGERLLISGESLALIGREYNVYSELKSFAFVPGTHLIVFNTRQLGKNDVEYKDWNRSSSKDMDDLLILDLDTEEISQLLPSGMGGDFSISPDGNLIAVQGDGRIDIVTIDGQVVHNNLGTYVPTSPYVINPRMFWTSDSKELIVSLPATKVADFSGPETLAIWRFSIQGGGKSEITLDPPLLDADFEVSPDGDWILYNYFYYPGKTEESITSGLYLGNLRDGSSQLYAQGTNFPIWNPDSKHFVYDGPFLGDVDNSPLSMGHGRFLNWVDASHYLFYQSETEKLMLVDINGDEIDIPHAIPASSLRSGSAGFSFVSIVLE